MYVSLEMAKFTMTLSTAGLKADRLVSLYDWKSIRMLVFFNHQMLIATSTSSQSQKNKSMLMRLTNQRSKETKQTRAKRGKTLQNW